jgi:hypothetical protein
MSLFQCDNCGCCENTALAAQGFAMMAHLFDWSYNPELEGKVLCSACGPVHYNDGTPTKYGVWHNRFPRTFLPKGMFVTNRVGNLAHKETGDDNIMAYAVTTLET